MVAGTAAIYGFVFLDRLAPLYLVVILRQELEVSPAALAMLPVSLGLGWAVAMALGRWLSGRLTDRQRIALGTGGAIAFHVASALVGSWGWFLLLRFLGGVFAGTVAPPITGLLFHWAPVARRGRDIGIVFSSTRLFGSLLSPIIVLSAAVAFGWQQALQISAAGLFLALLFFLVVVPSSPGPTTTRQERRAEATVVLRAHGKRNIALSAGVGILLITWLTVVSQSGPTLLVESLGIDPDQAGTILGMFGIGGWLAALIVPTLSDRIGRRLAVGGATAVGGLSGLVLAFLLAQDGTLPTWTPALLLAIGGLAMGALPLALSVIPAEAVQSGDPGRAVTWPVVGAEVIGSALLPGIALLGFLPDRLAFAGAAAGLLLATVIAQSLAVIDDDARTGPLRT